jgi:hypothetical protein
MQDKKLIAFYSRKLNTAQKRYTTTERELLSAIETCKEYKNTLTIYPIIVFIDHKNNIFNDLKALSRILCQLLLLEEYGVTFEYLQREKYVSFEADALSRLDIDILKFRKEIEKASTLLSRSENSNIIYIKSSTQCMLPKDQQKSMH